MIRDEALNLALASRGAAVLMIVAGDTSMEPMLSGGDAVLAVPLAGDPARGDLIVFRQKDEIVVHRYLGRARTEDGRPCLRTRGDGRQDLDPPVDRSSVRARAAAVRRDGAWRSLDGRRSRVLAGMIAWHDLAWAGAIHLLRPLGLGGAAAAVDRGLLRAIARLASPLADRRIPDPGNPEPHVSV